MSPAEKIPRPFRWQFLPVKDEKDGSIRWTWRAYSQGGDQVMSASEAFETLTECLQHAKSHGYAPD